MKPSPFDCVCVVGLGKLGLPWACILAAKGIDVVGIDTAVEVVEMVKRAAYDGHEPDVGRLLTQHHQRLNVTVDFEAVASTQAAFIVVPTPTDSDDGFSLEYVMPAIEQIARVVKRARIGDYTIVLVSTVMPGSCEEFILPAIERVLGQRSGCRIHLAYCPEFVALGRVVHGMLHPDLVLIGAEDEAVVRRLTEFYAGVVENNPAVVAVTLASAEVAKLGINAMVSFKITCANLLARLCHELPHASVNEVELAVGSDSRIGPKYLRGGLGFGGPCLPRDVRALASLCRDLGIAAEIPETVSNFNASIPQSIVRLVARYARAGVPVGVLGLAYRPQTAIADESQACQLAREFYDAGYKVVVHDPLLRLAQCRELVSLDIHECNDVATLLAHCEIVVIAMPDEEYESIDPRLLEDHIVVDCWRLLRRETVEQCLRHGAEGGFKYVPLGIGGERSTIRSQGFVPRLIESSYVASDLRIPMQVSVDSPTRRLPGEGWSEGL